MEKIVKKDLKILGLDEKEELIIQTLKQFGPMRPIDLANKTEVKRTTINFLLKKLLGRGLVDRVRVRGHYEWLINGEKKIQQSIGGLFGYFNVGDAAEMIHMSPDIGVEIFRGKKNILTAYERVLEAGRNNRVFAIQGNKSVMAAKKLEKSYLSNLQNKFKEHKIILEGILGESVIHYFDDLDVEMLKAYEGRMVVAYFVSDLMVDFDMDIMIFQKIVVLVNFEKSLVLVVKNEEIFKVILKLYEAMKLSSRKIDLNKYIKEIIERRAGSHS
ncbi:MarR family transcriptional regulator [Patescibacteria group bacterium]|nr:MarR family transcriptional regulator [Patescibacteria group bacterium]MBU1922269.1 MarR family transcriptional regulator [Patescibacteria group bacterium]